MSTGVHFVYHEVAEHELCEHGTCFPCPNHGHDSTQSSNPGTQMREYAVMESQVTDQQAVMVVHQVECDRKMAGHGNHLRTATYLDNPRLWKGDCRASALRGKHLMRNVEGYSELHQEVTLVMRYYDCEAFHQGLRGTFQRKEPPFRDPEVPNELLLYFEVVDEDCPSAIPSKDVIHISASLRTSMDSLAAQKPELFAGWETNMVAPYLQLYHNRHLIRSLIACPADGVEDVQIMGLLEYVEDTFGAEYREADDLFSRGIVAKKHLHKLFVPNELLVCFEDGEPVGFMSSNYPKPGQWPVSIDCFTWVYDGQFIKNQRVFDIDWTSNQEECDVADLNVYPLRLISAGSVMDHLRTRGGMFWKCRRRYLVASTAPVGSFGIKVANPRYMIDMETYKQLHQEEETPTEESETLPGDVLGEELMASDEPPDENFVLMLPPTIIGFGMHDKKWRTIKVKHLSDIQWNEGAFSQLVLDPFKKELIKAMITGHMAYNKSTDVIEGKGNGLIMLLYGGPGTGKTLTAESVAELAMKPLYRITCGDIGTDPESAEEYLDSAFYIATRWDAVLLLDESDVFLEQRQETDLERNALVSIFLRALEYYEGIMILTSNRVNTFDEAFRSRMQLALYYPPLNEEGRFDIWTNFIALLEEEQRHLNPKTCAPKDLVNTTQLSRKASVLAKERLNGREIRNAIITARQLARFRGQVMEYDHIKLTIGVAKEFEENRE